MRILMISQYPWKKENSFGNTYSNIFGKINGIEIAHIYLMNGVPDRENVVTDYYQISEDKVINSIIKPKRFIDGVGERVIFNELQERDKDLISAGTNKSLYSKLLDFGKRHHWDILFFAREIVWKIGKINYGKMMDFVKEFQPDLLFLPFSNLYYTNRLALYIKANYNVPMVMEMAMDHYSMKRISCNPLFWLDRICKRSMIRKLARESEKIYVISEKLKKELEKSLSIQCELLYKIPDKSRLTVPYQKINTPIKFLYTGNIYANRWKTLKILVDTLNETKAGVLSIYTATPISNKMRKALVVDGVSNVYHPVNQDTIINLQNEADVLVHAEAFDRKNRLIVRCAISTKIMDYISVGRTILAIGPQNISSIEYLNDNELALIAHTKDNLKDIIMMIHDTPQYLVEFSCRGQQYIDKYLDAGRLRENFFNSLKDVVDKYKIFDN